MAVPDPRHPTYATDAIPSDVKNGLFLGNAALDNVVSCVEWARSCGRPNAGCW